MFSQFGKIIDVVALKTLRLRGQAWIVFSDVAAATNAKNTMQGFPFFEKPIVSNRKRKIGSNAGVCGSAQSPRCWLLQTVGPAALALATCLKGTIPPIH